MEKIKINYKKNWDNEGYCTTQNIKISKNLLNEFNIFLEKKRKYIKNKHYITSEEMNLLTYGGKIDNLNRCLHLTQLSLFHYFLTKNNINCDRLKLNRNTMLILKSC